MDAPMAAVLALLLHAGLGWVAMQAAPVPSRAPAPSMALVLVRHVPSPEARRGVGVPQADRGSRPVDGDPPAMSARFVTRRDAPSTPAATPALRVTTLDDAWTRVDGEPGTPRFRPDPFEHRPARLPGGGARRFRMRPPRSPASALAGAATLLGLRPEGYEASPCPRIARNVSALATSLDPADRAALAHELDMQDSFCR
jgi:hypothetical protein